MPYFKVFLYSILPWCPFCTYTVGIPWIWIGVGWTMPFFFKPLRIAAKAKNRCHVEPREALCRQSVSCVGEGVCRNLVEISSLWSFWLEEGCCLHQPRCETSSWHAHFGCLACSGYSEVPSSCKYSRIHGEQKKLDKKKKRIHWSRTHLVFMGSSYMIPLAISFTDIRADRGERVSLASVLTFSMFRK